MAMDTTTELLGMLGEPGKYSWIIFVVICFNYFPLTWNHMMMVVIGARPPHRCKIPEGNYLNESVPFVRGKPDSCHAFENFTKPNSSVTCPNGWEYTLLERESTIVTEVINLLKSIVHTLHCNGNTLYVMYPLLILHIIF